MSPGARSGPGSDDGVVALEFALVLPVVALLLVTILQLMGTARDALSVQSVARQAARAAALDDGAAARSWVAAHLPEAVVSVDATEVTAGPVVTVTVTLARDVWGRPVRLSHSASAVVEPGR